LLVIVCQQGYQSSLAAANLHELCFTRATDLDGDFEARAAAGLRSLPRSLLRRLDPAHA
jgi:rhodanese-related sulfurtransferase